METFLDILKYILPSLVVLLTAYVVLRRQSATEAARQVYELKKNQLATISPIRLRGYERLALLLDRTIPENVLLTMDLPHMTSLELQTQLLERIRMEFDHNASQQIYVSNELWMLIKLTKESLLQLVNTCAATLDQGSPALKLAELLISAYNYTPNPPTEQALTRLKAEIQELF